MGLQETRLCSGESSPHTGYRQCVAISTSSKVTRQSATTPGSNLPNLEEAHIFTVEAIMDIRAKQPILAAEGTGWMLTVADCTGAVLFTVSLDSRLASLSRARLPLPQPAEPLLGLTIYSYRIITRPSCP